MVERIDTELNTDKVLLLIRELKDLLEKKNGRNLGAHRKRRAFRLGSEGRFNRIVLVLGGDFNNCCPLNIQPAFATGSNSL